MKLQNTHQPQHNTAEHMGGRPDTSPAHGYEQRAREEGDYGRKDEKMSGDGNRNILTKNFD